MSFDTLDDDYGDDSESFDESSDTIICSRCGAEIYYDAEQCPRCGAYVVKSETKPRSTWWIRLCQLTVVVLLILFLGPEVLRLVFILLTLSD